MDIAEFLAEIGGATQDEVKVPRLPDGAGRASQLCDCQRGFSLPIVHDGRERRPKARDEQVRVVRHDDAGEECESQHCPRFGKVFEAEIAVLSTEFRNAARDIRGHEEEPTGMFDAAQARHAAIVM